MSIRTLSSETLKVHAAPAATTPSTRPFKSIPHISQLHPKGADKNYVNGAYNCAPTVVAMLARGAGLMKNVSDANLISSLGQGLVGKQGTDAEGVAKMLGRAGLSFGGKMMAGNYSDAALKDHLAKGNKLIAQVALTGSDKKDASAHYVLITGVNSKGNYIIQDPMAKKAFNVTPEQLRQAINDAPPDGGLIMPVAPPTIQAPASKPSTPVNVARAVAAFAGARAPSGSSVSAAPLKKPSTDMFSRATAPKTSITSPELPAAPAPTSTSNASWFKGINSATLNAVANAVAGMAPPDANAFSVDDAALEGVDTAYHADAGSGTPRYTSEREQQNVASMNIDYGKTGSKRGIVSMFKQVTPANKGIEEFVQELRQRKQARDPEVAQILERLEGSLVPKDILVLRRFKELELRDPGIGKKTSIDSF